MPDTSYQVGSSRLKLIQGDITQVRADAIVNAANSALAGGGGVDGAIHRAAGPTVMDETRRRYPDGCPAGSAVITGAGKLPARHVIHAVGPIWCGGKEGEESVLRGAYTASLQRAVETGDRSVVFPAISTGAYGYPLDAAARVAVEAICDFLERREEPLEVAICLFSDELKELFRAAAEERCGV